MEEDHGLNTFRLGAGYNHDFNCVYGLGFEAAFGQSAKDIYHYSDGASTTVKSDTLEFLSTHTFHIHQFDLVGKFGGVRLTPKVSGKGASSDATQIRPEAGIGAVYNATSHLALTAGYIHVFGNQIDTITDIGSKTPALNEALLGVRYTFHD